MRPRGKRPVREAETDVLRARPLLPGREVRRSGEAAALMVADSGITKIGEPEDVANLVAVIVSPQNRYLHGALIDLDGGTTKRCEPVSTRLANSLGVFGPVVRQSGSTRS